MKNSGVQWLGDIPARWDVLPFRRVFEITKRLAGRTGLDVLSVTQQGIRIKDLTSNEGQMAQDYSNYQLVYPFDFVMNHMDLLTGYVDISQYSGVTSPDYRVFRARNINSIEQKFFLYIFQICYKCRIFYQLGQGVSGFGRWRLPAKQMLLFGLPIPPLPEQRAIVTILDKISNEIDEMVSLQERIIDELKAYKQSVISEAVTKGLGHNVQTKDSGINWLGQIPIGWSVIRLRFLFSITGGNGFKDEFQGQTEGDYPFYKTSDINGVQPFIRDAVNYVSEEIASSEKYNIIPINAIIVSKIGAAMYKNHRKISTCPCCIDNNLEALIPLRNDCIKYLYYLTKIIDFAWFDNQGTIPSVNNSKLKDFFVPDTPIQEQQDIANYLDTKCSEIDTLIALKQSKIEALKEYKKSIVYEYVTGKKGVEA